MIAAAFGVPAERARQRLERLGAAAGAGSGAYSTTKNGALAAWPTIPAGHLAGGAAWIGTPLGLTPQGVPGAPSELRGAFAMLGLERDQLVLARGRFGGRSLYYTREDDMLVASSHLEALIKSGGSDRAIDATGLAGLITGRGHDVARTVFASTLRVPSGAVLRFAAPTASPTRTATSHGDVPDLDLPEAELVAELRRRLVGAVARAVGDAKHVAVTVSGGIDSSTVLALVTAQARGASPREIAALNVAFEAPGNDQPCLRALTRELGVEPIRFAPAEFAGVGLDPMVIDARPLKLISSLWQVHMAREARARGADVLLTGSGGDDVLDGDLSLFDPIANPRGIGRAIRAALRLRGPYFAHASRARRLESMIVRPVLRGLVPEWLRARVRAARPSGAPRSFDWAGPTLRTFLTATEVRGQRPPLRSTRERFEELACGPEYLDYIDARTQVELATDLPAADPFFDPELVEFLAAMPAEAFFTGGYVKGLLRAAMRGIVPDVVLDREDKGEYEPAFAAHFRALGGLECIRPLLEMRGLSALGLVDADLFRARFEAFARDMLSPTPWIELWPVIAAEAFVQKWST